MFLYSANCIKDIVLIFDTPVNVRDCVSSRMLGCVLGCVSFLHDGVYTQPEKVSTNDSKCGYVGSEEMA
jgi:hypothetical protein